MGGDRGMGRNADPDTGSVLKGNSMAGKRRYKTVVKHFATSGPLARAKTILTKRFDQQSPFAFWAFVSVVLHIDVEPRAVAVLKSLMSGCPARIGQWGGGSAFRRVVSSDGNVGPKQRVAI